MDILYKTDGTTVELDGAREEYPVFFRLLIPGTVEPLAIQEPKGWKDSPEKLNRSERWHGFNYETLGEGKLTFDPSSGYEQILACLRSQGPEAKIRLQHGTFVDPDYIVEYEGVLDLMSYDHDGIANISCSVEKYTLHDKVQAKIDAKLDLYSSVDLDGNDIGAVVPSNIILHSKALQERFLSEYDTEQNITGTFLKDNDLFVFPECQNPSVSDIKTFYPKTFACTNNNPVTDKQFIWKAYSSGNYRFQITFTFEGSVQIVRRFVELSLGELKISSAQIRAFLIIERDLKTTEYPIGDKVFYGGQSINAISLSFSGSLDTYIDIRQGDNIYIFAEVKYTYKGANELRQTNYSFTNTNTSIRIDGVSTNDQSGVKGLTFFNAFRRAIRQVTGIDAVVSPFFQTGCGKKYLITNGFSIRRYPDKSPKVSLKELLESADALFFIGYEYNNTETGEKIVIRKADDFYSSGEILQISECFDYKETVAAEYIYSALEIGYTKFLEEGLNYLDEYNTRHEDQLPIEGHENRTSIMSSLIGSGYAIETTRREQFNSQGSATLSKNLFDKTKGVDSKLLNEDDTIEDNDLYGYSDFIAVSAGSQYTGFDGINGMQKVVYYNASKVFVSGESSEETTVTIPSGVSYIRFSYVVSRKNSFQFEKSSSATDYESYGYRTGVNRNSSRYDDDCFVIAYKEDAGNPVTQSAVFFGLGTIRFISMQTLPSWFAAGVVFAVTGTTNNNKNFEISYIQIKDDGSFWVYTVESPSGETATATFSPSSVLLGAAEKDEAFEIVENVISPETSYNLRITPKRMLYNRSRWLLGSLFYKANRALIKNTQAKMNGDLQTKFLDTETCLLGDVDRDLITEKESVQKVNFGYKEAIFEPQWINFSCYTSRSDWNTIRRALRGLNEDSTDYGYLTVTSPDGTDVSGYPFEISREKESGKTIVKMIKKA